ncbi:hypothetical protein [Caulobacter sp. 17J80-11]|uniref:hypothetical protein n=1 Tax=Caulobacter sp. 17J80-11 TaxID=2763502 RepID=UPI001653E368|nr:hypothetical protein [Caulobacter sp. 17J80-11]MBC6982412.1 hypothetical protein [Caulobacter sp. 17J80-11]
MRVLTFSIAAACAAALTVPAWAQPMPPAAKAPPPPAEAPAAPATAAPTPATADSVKAGASVKDSAGVDLGTVDKAMLDESGALKGVAIRTRDGDVYALPAAGFTVQGPFVVAGWTKEQIDQARKAQAPAAPGEA